MTTRQSWREHLNFLELTTTHLSKTPVPEGGDTVEAISRLEHVAGRLKAIAASLKSEIPERANWSGGGYRTVDKSQGYVYSFNQAAILRDIAAAHDQPFDSDGRSAPRMSASEALAVAAAEGAVTVTWKITGLEKLFAKLDRPLTTEPREVADDVESPSHVGKVAKPRKTDIEPIGDVK